MRYIIFVLIAIINAIIAGMAGAATIYSIAPDILLCCIFSVTIIENSPAGIWLGLLGGFTLDILYSQTLGFYALPYVLIAFAVYMIVPRLKYIDNYILPTVFVFTAYLIKDLFAVIAAAIIGRSVNFGVMFVKGTIWSALFTAIFMWLIHLIMRRLYATKRMKAHSGREFARLRKIKKTWV